MTQKVRKNPIESHTDKQPEIQQDYACRNSNYIFSQRKTRVTLAGQFLKFTQGYRSLVLDHSAWGGLGDHLKQAVENSEKLPEE